MQAKEIGNWVLDRKLNEGGMGVVYLAHHRMMSTPAAVKVMSGALLSNPTFREKFMQEATSQARLRHSHIVQVLDYAQQGDQLFLVMEYLDGGTLADVVDKAGGPVDIARALAWVKQALSGLDYAHRTRVIHRDVKPSNILLDHHGQAKVTDFGIALMIGGKRLTSTGVTLGTAAYMSPEQIRRPNDVDHRADVYAMGVVLYELVTGRVPFEDHVDFVVMEAQVKQPPPPPRSINPNIPATLERIILRALEKDADKRYSGCAEFAKAIESFEHDETARLPSIQEPRGRGRRVSPWGVAAIVASLAAALALGSYGTKVWDDRRASPPGGVPSTHEARVQQTMEAIKEAETQLRLLEDKKTTRQRDLESARAAQRELLGRSKRENDLPKYISQIRQRGAEARRAENDLVALEAQEKQLQERKRELERDLEGGRR